MKNTSHTTSKLFPIFLFALLLLNACNPDEIPEPTEPTFPYFHMEVDGELWAPSGASFGGGAPFDVSYRPDLDGFISLAASSIYKDLSLITFSTENIEVNKKIGINRNFKLKDKGFEGNCIGFDLDTLQSNFLLIKELDTNSRIIKVNFEMDCLNECGDIHRIRKGVIHNYYGS